MSCSFTSEQIDATRAFHGHSCPGLAIGMRAAELCLRRLGHDSENRLTAVTETDMCGVDAIQFLTGCTFGKGNLVHRDYGKMAFSFFRQESGEGFRARLRPYDEAYYDKTRDLMIRSRNGEATREEEETLRRMRQERIQDLLDADLDALFEIDENAGSAPRGARVLDSIRCSACGEATMESRIRRYFGEFLCIPCFEQVDQKR